MSTPSQPQQLAALEAAFASAPGSEAWRPLAEAYLAAGRHLEATVIAKKAARTRPGDAAPRGLVVRVLAAQGKVERAREELAALLRAHPADEGALALARELKLEAPASPTASAPANPTATAPAARRRPPPPHLDAGYAQDLARRYGDEPPEPAARRRARARRALLRTAALAVGLGAALAALGAVAASRRARAAEVERLVAEARPLLERDTWSGAREGGARCERAAGLDGDAAEARACAAWAAAVRFADHGEAEGRDLARRQLAALRGDAPARAAAAAALLRAAEGDARGAADALRQRAAQDGGPLLLAVLGEALLAAGDLDGARDALAGAQRLAPGDVRAARLLAEAYRRRGGAEVAQAELLYEIALGRLAPDHPAALLGRSRLLIDRRALGEALALADRVHAMVAEASPRQRAVAQALRARALALAGRKDDAAVAERAALALDGAGREVREILAAPVAAAAAAGR
jgi:hypothetical protein